MNELAHPLTAKKLFDLNQRLDDSPTFLNEAVMKLFLAFDQSKPFPFDYDSV